MVMKRLKPSMRNRKRYIAFKVISDNCTSKRNITKKEMWCSITEAGSELFGDDGTSKFDHNLIHFDETFGILKTTHRYVSESRAVMATINAIGECPVMIVTLKVSGTIKSLKTMFGDRKENR